MTAGGDPSPPARGEIGQAVPIPSLAFSRPVLGDKPLAHAGTRFLSRKGRDRAPARDLLAARLAGRRRRLAILPARGEA